MLFITDKKRHLICSPYSKQGLHAMATSLGIKKCWFHKDHYDIPMMRQGEIEEKCLIVSPKMIVKIIKGEDLLQMTS